MTYSMADCTAFTGTNVVSCPDLSGGGEHRSGHETTLTSMGLACGAHLVQLHFDLGNNY